MAKGSLPKIPKVIFPPDVNANRSATNTTFIVTEKKIKFFKMKVFRISLVVFKVYSVTNTIFYLCKKNLNYRVFMSYKVRIFIDSILDNTDFIYVFDILYKC